MKRTVIAIGSALGFTSLGAVAQDTANAGIPLGVELGRTLGTQLPFEVGSLAAISALSLIIGMQLIKRRK